MDNLVWSSLSELRPIALHTMLEYLWKEQVFRLWDQNSANAERRISELPAGIEGVRSHDATTLRCHRSDIELWNAERSTMVVLHQWILKGVVLLNGTDLVA